jgi:signal transduction histidine kinase
MLKMSPNWQRRLQNALQFGVPAVAITLFAIVAIGSFVHGSRTRDSLDTFQKNVLGQSVTSNDSALASAVVAYKLSEYLMGNDVEEELRARVDVVTTQLNLGAKNFTGTAVEHTRMSQITWDQAQIGLARILDGNRDPNLIDSTFSQIAETRIHAKQSADAWLTQVLYGNLTTAQDQLEAQVKFFSIITPIAAIGLLIVLVLAIRARGNARLQAENEKLVNINEEKTQFVTQVSHELKTPLTSMIAFTDLLIGNSNEPLTQRQSNHLKIVKRNAEYLNLLVNDIVDVSQLETGNLSVELGDINMNDLLSDLRSSFGPIVERKQQTLEVPSVSDSLIVIGDRLRLLQVLSNLVGNSTKYSERGTTICIEVSTTQDRVFIAVKDQGYGMTVNEKKKAFDMFYRGTSTDIQKESGTGIGLAVSKSIVEAHGGTISIESTMPRGTVMIIGLPGKNIESDSGIDSLFVA